MTLVYAPELYPQRRNYRSPANEAYLRENVGIDPAILAAALGIPTHFVVAYQRQLGLRKILNHTERRRVK